MADYQLLIPDPTFSFSDETTTEDLKRVYGPVNDSQKNVRRPLNALETRKDTYASLSVRRGSGRAEVNNTSADSNNRSQYTTNLMIQSINYSTQEKMQLSQTFDRDRLLFFGTQVPTLKVSAILIENETFQWLHEFYENYVSTMGGSELARTGSRAELVVEDKRFEGYLTNLSFERNAQNRHIASINFTLSVTKTEFTRKLGELPGERAGLSETTLKNLAAISDAFSQDLINLEVSGEAATTFEQQVQAIAGRQGFEKIDTRDTFEAPTGISRPNNVRQAYPLEFVNSNEGFSKDNIRDQVLAEESLDFYVSSVRAGRDTFGVRDTTPKPPPVRRTTPSQAEEDILFNTKYEKFVPSAMSVEMTQLVRVGKALAVVAGRSLLSESLGFTADTTGEIYLDTLEVAGRAF